MMEYHSEYVEICPVPCIKVRLIVLGHTMLSADSIKGSLAISQSDIEICARFLYPDPMQKCMHAPGCLDI